jgi:serine/threonine-protein kinase
VLGTAAYLAPEQAAGEEVTAAADVYALGVVLYELLAGRTPYTVESLTQLLARGHEQPIPALRELAPEVPEALEDVVMRCLARIPTYRPPSAEALASDLAATSVELPTVSLGSSPGDVEAPTRVATAPVRETARPRESRFPAISRRTAALAIAAVALVLLVGGVLAFGDDSDSGSPSPAAQVERSPAEQAEDFSAWLRENSQP